MNAELIIEERIEYGTCDHCGRSDWLVIRERLEQGEWVYENALCRECRDK